MTNKPKPINPAMPTNLAWVMVACGIIIGTIVAMLLPFGFGGSFIWGVIIMIAVDLLYLVIYRRITITKQKAANAAIESATDDTTK